VTIEHRFYHEVLAPFIRFRARSAENICVQENNNDVIVLAQEAATAAYHFPEAVRGEPMPMDNPAAETLRQRLRDVVDTRKHGTLTDPKRQIAISAALAYEANDSDEFRYLGTHIDAYNKRFGQFELTNTIELFINEIRRELSIKLDTQLTLPTYPFSKTIVTYVTNKTFYAKNVRIRTFKRTIDGLLQPVDPKLIEFEVRELRKPRAADKGPGNS
jgi:hypothetical protein